MKENEKLSLVDLGKRLLEASRNGQADVVKELMQNGAPFTTDWVCTLHGVDNCLSSMILLHIYTYLILSLCYDRLIKF